MKNPTPLLDMDHEVAAIAEFLAVKWTPISGITKLVSDIRDAAVRSAIALLPRGSLFDIAIELGDAREALLKEALSVREDDLLYAADTACWFLSEAERNASILENAALALNGPWDYEGVTRALRRRLVCVYPDLVTARPLGWDSLAADYEDFDGMEEYDPTGDRELLKGSNVSKSLGGPFTHRVALPYVMYDEKCQSRRADEVLVGAILAHFIELQAYLNSVRLRASIVEALPGLDEPRIHFEQEISSPDPLVKALLLVAGRHRNAEAEFKEYQATAGTRKKYSDLNAVEKRDADARAVAICAEVLDPDIQLKWEKKMQAKEDGVRALLKQCYPA